VAWAASLALHALLIIGTLHVSWDTVERDATRPIEAVWLSELRIPDPAVVPVAPERPSDVPPELPSPRTEPVSAPPDTESAPPEPASEPAPPKPAPLAEPERPDADTRAESPPAEDAAAAEAARTPEPERAAPEAPRDDTTRGFVVTEADLEEAWQRALEAMREEREREEGYLTFSLDDLIEAPPPDEEGPSESIFEAAERYRGSAGRSVLSPGAARTRIGRALAEFCNALTGGFALGLNGLGLASVCADPGESPKLFAHIKPSYLRSRPVCTEVETGSTDAEAPTIKCELVEQDAMARPEQLEPQ